MTTDAITAILSNYHLSGKRRLLDLTGMTQEDWRRVHRAYLGFITQVRLIALEVEARQAALREASDATERD